jgi:hypothetical protein
MTVESTTNPASARRRFIGRSRRCAVLLLLALAALSKPVSAEVHGGYRVTPSDPPGGISPFSITGWAVSSCGKPDVHVLLDGKTYSVLVPIYRLPDIRKRFAGCPGADTAGFWTSIDPASLALGPHVFEIRLAHASCGEVSLGEIRFEARAPISAPAAAGALAFLLLLVPFLLSAWLVPKQGERAGSLPLVPISAAVLAAFAATIILSGKFGEPLSPIKPGIFSSLGNWDGEHYLRLAVNGYGSPGSEQDWGWFPLFPMMLHLLSFLPLPLPLLGSAFNFGCALGTVLLLSKLYPAMKEGVLAYVLFPASMFFVACYSEASFVLLLASTLFAVKRGRPTAAALFGALAALCRPSGFLIALFALEFLRAPRRWRGFAVAFAGPAAGLLFWYSVPSRWTGDARKYLQIQRAFGRDFSFHPGRLLDSILVPAAHPLTSDLPALLALLLVLVGAAALLRRGDVAEGLFSASVVLFPLSTGTLTSMARYALAAFPAIVLLGSSVRNRAILCLIWAVEFGFGIFLAERFGRYWYAG